MDLVRKMDRLLGVGAVKQLRSDHGTEFRNSTLVNFCADLGVSQNFSAVRTPEQNGVAERRNRTLIEAARTMLVGSGLRKGFWTEAIAAACYTQNRSIIVKHRNKTPYELFHGRKPRVSHFRVFGSPCFVLNQRDALGKFDAKSDDATFVGYSDISAAYRVYNLRRLVVEESAIVTFNEQAEMPSAES